MNGLLSVLALSTSLFAQQGEHWVATWASAPQQFRARPGAAPTPTGFKNQTIRMVVHSSIAGKRARLQFSNAFGMAPVTLGAVHVSLHGKGSAIDPASDKAVRFAGKPTCSIPAGALIISDPVDFDVPRLGDLAVSVYLPGETGPATTHALGLHTTYISKEGDFTGEAEIADASTVLSWFYLSAIDVMAPAEAFSIVTFGDSITDGATSTPDTDRSWPGILASRLPPTVGVANQGISGNRVLRDGAGVNALARFDRDVLGVSGVKWLTIMESINDIGIAGRPNSDPADRVTADELIAALNQMVERAHTHDIRVAGATLTPYESAGYYSETGEEMRKAVNNWIRTSGAFDAVIDFDKVTGDPEHPGRFLPVFNNTDHLHPNDAGYKAMADAVDLSLFTKHKGKKKRK